MSGEKNLRGPLLRVQNGILHPEMPTFAGRVADNSIQNDVGDTPNSRLTTGREGKRRRWVDSSGRKGREDDDGNGGKGKVK